MGEERAGFWASGGGETQVSMGAWEVGQEWVQRRGWGEVENRCAAPGMFGFRDLRPCQKSKTVSTRRR